MNCVSPAPCNLPVSIVTWCCYTNTHGAGEDWDSNQLVWSIFKTKQLLSSSISTAENSLLWFNFIFSWRACWRKAKLNKYFFCIVFWMLWLFEQLNKKCHMWCAIFWNSVNLQCRKVQSLLGTNHQRSWRGEKALITAHRLAVPQVNF